MNAKITLDNFLTPTEAQLNGTDTLAYKLQIDFNPLDHTALIIAFEFQSYVYLMLYVVIGLVMSIYIFVFFVYHYLVSRYDDDDDFFWLTLIVGMIQGLRQKFGHMLNSIFHLL